MHYCFSGSTFWVISSMGSSLGSILCQVWTDMFNMWIILILNLRLDAHWTSIKCQVQISYLDWSRFFFSSWIFFNLDQSRFNFSNCIFCNLDQSRFEICNWNLFNLDWSRFEILKCSFSNLDQSRFGIFSCTFLNLD